MTAREPYRCRCGRTLSLRDVERGWTSCSIPCAVIEQARQLDAMRAETPSDDDVLDGLLALKREEEAKRGGAR